MASIRILHLSHFEVAQCCDVKYGFDFVGMTQVPEQLEQMVVCAEWNVMSCFHSAWMARTFTAKTEYFEARPGKSVRQNDSQFASGRICQSANLVDWLKAGAGCDYDFHLDAAVPFFPKKPVRWLDIEPITKERG